MQMICAILTVLAAAEQEPISTTGSARGAVERAMVLLEKSSEVYQDERSCFSCHHQAVPILAMQAAKDRGLKVNERILKMQVDFTYDFLNQGKKGYLKGKGQGGKASTASYALLALEAAGRKRDDVTDAVTGFLVGMNEEQGYWKLTSRRPPSGASEITTAALSVRALWKWGTEKDKKRIEKRIARVRAWLLETRAKDTEDRVFRLLGLQAAGAEEKDVRRAADELLKRQRKDGGWAQLDSMESDAYATGSAMFALHEAGGLDVGDPAYRRGMKFLLETQKEDGTWYVPTRAKGFQKYFESGFPYGKDQFISIAATAWAAAALAAGAE